MKKILLIMLTIISLWVMTSSTVFAEDNFSCTNQLETFSDLLFNEPWKYLQYNNRFLIKNFCEKSALLSPCQENWAVYNPKSSLFLNLVCKNFFFKSNGDEFILNDRFTVEDGYLKIDSRTGLDLVQTYYKYQVSYVDENYCSPEKDLNLCELWRHFGKLFDKVLNDYFSIKQANAYGVQDLQTPNIEIVNSFTSWYFMQTKICDEWVAYYKKTCNTLQNVVKNAKKLLTKTRIIDVQKLKENEFTCEDKLAEDYDLLYCGLLDDRYWWSDDFLNLIYNELLWYRLFIVYYSDTISQDPNKYISRIYNNMQASDRNAIIKDNIDLMTSYYERSSFAVDKTKKLVNDLYRTFPIHVGFLMYQEDLKSLIDAYAKFWAPFITLYDKLRNVQDKNS